jgi:serine/threonine-protein kinase
VIGRPAAAVDEIAGYRIRSVLGEGAMGTVYLAERPDGGLCALKVLTRRPADDVSAAARFKREAQYAEALENPYILELYEAGEAPDGTLYLAMQYVPGEDLGAVLARVGPMDLAEALAILGQVGNALDAAHSGGLIHRDVKPGNIIVATERGPGPYAYLTDFGLSKNPEADSIALTKQGQFVGTTAYTAPEEILGQPRDHRVDIYSLGCVLFEAVVGEPPFLRDRELDVMYAHIGDPRPRPSQRRPQLPPELDAVIAKAMATSPDERYASCADLIAAAGALLPTGSVPAAAAEPPPASPSPAPPAPPAPAAAAGPAAPAAPAPASPSAAPPPPAPPVAVSLSPAPPAPSSQSLRLVVREGPAQGRELLVADELAISRLTTLGGALAADRAISRRHAQIRREPEGGFVVEDLYSANGTFVNGTRIEAPHPLRLGDELRIGATAFEVAAAAPPDSVVPLPAPDPLKRVAIRLELDLEAGQLSVAIEHGATARIVRDGDGWRVEIP